MKEARLRFGHVLRREEDSVAKTALKLDVLGVKAAREAKDSLVVTSGPISMEDAKKRCEKIAYQLAIFKDNAQEKRAVDEYKHEQCGTCFRGYWVANRDEVGKSDWGIPSNECEALWFGREPGSTGRVKASCTGRMDHEARLFYKIEGYI
ncbi:hypothetical protein RB195_020571 [Necator americanus]|uniref:Uncharacterized protein n=1 Tax=Necator americanus TaxID=51031 RepID=A0ABR1CKS1_NECAM